MHKRIREYLKVCQASGLSVHSYSTRGKHLKIYADSGAIVVLSLSPSDHRWRANAKALARRIARESNSIEKSAA